MFHANKTTFCLYGNNLLISVFMEVQNAVSRQVAGDYSNDC